MRMRVIAAILLVVGCGDKADSGVEGDTTFTEVETIVGQSCGFSSCHGGGAGGLTLDGMDDYATLVGVESTASAGNILVVAGDANGSYLIEKMEDASGITGDFMPPSGVLDQATIDQVRSWIDSGAADN